MYFSHQAVILCSRFSIRCTPGAQRDLSSPATSRASATTTATTTDHHASHEKMNIHLGRALHRHDRRRDCRCRRQNCHVHGHRGHRVHHHRRRGHDLRHDFRHGHGNYCVPVRVDGCRPAAPCHRAPPTCSHAARQPFVFGRAVRQTHPRQQTSTCVACASCSRRRPRLRRRRCRRRHPRRHPRQSRQNCYHRNRLRHRRQNRRHCHQSRRHRRQSRHRQSRRDHRPCHRRHLLLRRRYRRRHQNHPQPRCAPTHFARDP
jgi:hypothetical protein